jgi:very-short-patch-repair endonuclease
LLFKILIILYYVHLIKKEFHNVNKCYSCSCKESYGEQCIRTFLEHNNVKFVQEKRFDDCRDVKPLPFDFYLPENNLIIEFDGKHHYEETGLGNHEITKKHDKIKNQYCQSHNIDLLRIPYWEKHNIENIIINKLNL